MTSEPQWGEQAHPDELQQVVTVSSVGKEPLPLLALKDKLRARAEGVLQPCPREHIISDKALYSRGTYFCHHCFTRVRVDVPLAELF